MDDAGVYEDPGTAGQSPTTDVSRPEGGGTHSGSADGGNKIDPISAGPNIGNTIAGRDIDTVGAKSPDVSGGNPDAPQSGRGMTGHTGREIGEGDGFSKGAAAEQVNPGASQTGPRTSEHG